MRLELYGSGPPQEQVTRIRVRQNTDAIIIDAVDANGNQVEHGLLFELTPKGLECFCKVNKTLGFPLEGAGYIKVINK